MKANYGPGATPGVEPQREKTGNVPPPRKLPPVKPPPKPPQKKAS